MGVCIIEQTAVALRPSSAIWQKTLLNQRLLAMTQNLLPEPSPINIFFLKSPVSVTFSLVYFFNSYWKAN